MVLTGIRNRIAEEQSMPKHFDLSRRGLLALGACALARRSAAGDGAPFRITMGKSVIEVSLPSAGIDLAPPSLITWVTVAARAVTAYYGVFPTATATVTVNSIEDRAGVLNGTTYGGDPPRTRMGVGQHTTTRQLENDWTMTHEFVHLAFPDMTRQHHWLEEGQATYIEPIARAQIGTLAPGARLGRIDPRYAQGLPAPTTAAWISRAPGAAPTGAERSTACWRTCGSASAPVTGPACSRHCAACLRRTETSNTIGPSKKRFEPRTRR